MKSLLKTAALSVVTVLLFGSIMYQFWVTAFPKNIETERMLKISEQTIKGLAGGEKDMCHEPMTRYLIEKCR